MPSPRQPGPKPRPARAAMTMALAALGVGAAMADAQSTLEWASPVDGDFAHAAAWSPMLVPGPADTALFAGAGPYLVRSGTRTVAAVRLTNPQAALRIDAGAAFTLAGAAGPGRLVIHDASAGAASSLLVADGADIACRVVLNAPPGGEASACLAAAPLAAATISGPISGNGQIGGRLDLAAIVDASTPGHRVEFVDGDARLVAPAGRVRAQGGGAIGLQNSAVSGGLWDGGDGAELRSTSGAIRDAAIIGQWRLSPGGDLTLGGAIAGDGDLVVEADASGAPTVLRLEDAATVTADFFLDAPPDALPAARVERASAGPTPTLAGVVSGRGQLLGGFTIAGTLSPGTGETDAGVLAAEGPLTLAPTARLRVTIAGPAEPQFDRVTNTDALALGGVLEIRFVGGYQPEPGATFEVLTASAITGAFSAISASPAGPYGPAHAVYLPRAVLVVACAADRDGDGALTLFDFLEFQNQFDAGDPRADLDGDGALTLFDFLAFQNRFAAGCG